MSKSNFYTGTSAEKKMKSQAKALDLGGIDELYDYILLSLVNGNRNQAEELYKALPRAGKLEFLKWICRNEDQKTREFFLNFVR
jgi:hypothetical protein